MLPWPLLELYPALDAIANDVVVNITTLKWVMPSVTPSLDKQLELLEVIKNKETVTLAFLNKRIYQCSSGYDIQLEAAASRRH